MTISNRDRVLMVVSTCYVLLVASIAARTGYDVRQAIHSTVLYGVVPVVAIWGIVYVGASWKMVLSFSVVWFALVFYFTIVDGTDIRTSISDLIFIGMLPLVIIWGGRWISYAHR